MRFRALWPFRGEGIPTYDADNIVGAGTNVRGDLRGPGGFRVDGAVTGAVESDGPVVIGERGSVEGTIKGRDVVVLGRVHGDVIATGHLEIGPEGRVMGDVAVLSLRIHGGGTFYGESRIGDSAGEARPATSTSPFGILPVGPASQKPKVRTLPPPLGGVPPPAPSPAVTAPLPTLEGPRPAPRESGEARIELPRDVKRDDTPRKAAAND
jgi:cytoskeletal protein CcmA (bactofilin family)